MSRIGIREGYQVVRRVYIPRSKAKASEIRVGDSKGFRACTLET
jgi:hypothetical protein